MNQLMRKLLFLPPQASSMAAEIDALHYVVILTTLLGAALTTAVAVFFVVKYRARGPEAERPRDKPAPRPPVWVEVGVVVGLFGLFILWWIVGFSQYVRARVAPPDTLDVYVTAKQWMWKFAYPDGHSSLGTLFVPQGRPVKLIMTSRDVIHSFYVPDFRAKQDVIPGRYTTVWFTATIEGAHQILCAEYCGTGHSTMRGQVVALAPADYARWLGQAAAQDLSSSPDGTAAGGPASGAPSMARVGERVAADRGCLRCHTVDGTPHIGPTWAGLYGSSVPLADGQAVLADEPYLTESMMDPLAKVRRGFRPVMPSYQGLLQAPEAAAVVEFIKSLRDVPAAAAGPMPPPTGPLPSEPVTP